MKRTPPAYGHEYDRHIGKPNDAEDGGEDAATFRFVHHLAQEEICHVDEPEHEGGGQARLPGPPRPPGAAGPDGAGEQGDAGEHDAYLSSGDGDDVPPGRPRLQVRDARQEYDEESQEGRPGGGHMEVEDALKSPPP